MFEPTNEQGVIILFAQQVQRAGIEIVEIATQYPDAVIKRGDKIYRTEFEFIATNFKQHGHDPDKCDLIVCWENDWENCPLPVIALKGIDWDDIEIDQTLSPFGQRQVNYWKERALEAECKLKKYDTTFNPVESEPFDYDESNKTKDAAYQFLVNAHQEGHEPTGAEVARYIDRSDSMGRRLKRELWPEIINGNGKSSHE